jgi:hypothetical protein
LHGALTSGITLATFGWCFGQVGQMLTKQQHERWNCLYFCIFVDVTTINWFGHKTVVLFNEIFGAVSHEGFHCTLVAFLMEKKIVMWGKKETCLSSINNHLANSCSYMIWHFLFQAPVKLIFITSRT